MNRVKLVADDAFQRLSASLSDEIQMNELAKEKPMRVNVLMLGAVAAIALASGVVVAEDAAIEDRVRTLVPQVSNLVISETPVPGVMEVRINNDIVYMSEDGRYLMQGQLIDLETQTDLTDAAKSYLRREQLAALDRSKLVSFGPEEADYELLVFTDTDCGYCRRLHDQIDEYAAQGIQINYAAFPRAGVGSDTFNTMVSVWCSEDRQEAMDIAKAGGQPPEEQCDSPVAEQYNLGRSVGVTGTPSMLTFDGEMIPGYVPPQQLRERLDRMHAARN